MAFLYIKNEQYKKEIPFTIVSKRIKYLRINLINEVKDLHKENYKTLLKEIKNINGKTSHVHGLGDLILLILFNITQSVL